METIRSTDFHFPGQTGKYSGKVRDVYFVGDVLVMVATDRISAFDVILPEAIPFKGQILNQIAYRNLEATRDVVPNWVISSPDPNVTIGHACEAFPVEMVVRGYLACHAWREYALGKFAVCGVPIPEGLKENDRLPHPIITPTTKAKEGHDEDISREAILDQKLISESDYKQLEAYTLALYKRGNELAAKQGLILVDTKYEFGKKNGTIYLIDEVHTPDSSRYFYAEGYKQRQNVGEKQKQLSKEFVREWLMLNGFQGKKGQKMPEMTSEIVKMISERYIELFLQITGEKPVTSNEGNLLERIRINTEIELKKLQKK